MDNGKVTKVVKPKILIMAAFAFFAVFGVLGCGQSDEKTDRALAQIAVEANKDLPIMIDAQTRLNSIETLPGKKIRYNNTIIDTFVEDIDVESFKESQGRRMLAIVKNNLPLETFRKRGVTFIYSYHDKAENEVAVFEYTPEDYK